MLKPTHPKNYTIIKSGIYCIDDLGVLLRAAAVGDDAHAPDDVTFLKQNSANKDSAGPLTFSDGKSHIWCKFHDGVQDGLKTTPVMVIESKDKALMLRCGALLGAHVMNNDELNALQSVPKRKRLAAVRALCSNGQGDDLYTRSAARVKGLRDALLNGAVNKRSAQRCADIADGLVRIRPIAVVPEKTQVCCAPFPTDVLNPLLASALTRGGYDFSQDRDKITISEKSTQQTTQIYLNALPSGSHELKTARAEEIAGYLAHKKMTFVTLEEPAQAGQKRAPFVKSVNALVSRALSLQSLEDAVAPVIAEQVEAKGFADIDHAPISLATHEVGASKDMTVMCLSRKAVNEMADHVTGTLSCGPVISDVVCRALQMSLDEGAVRLERDPNGDVLHDVIRVGRFESAEKERADISFNANFVKPEEVEDATKAAISGYTLVGVRERGTKVKEALKEMLHAVTLDKAVQIIDREREKEDEEQTLSPSPAPSM